MSSNRIALVTGGAGGLGYTICTKLGEKGYRVVLNLDGTHQGFSYGREIDAQIKTMGDKVDHAVVTPDKIVAKVAAGRDSYMLAAPEEFAIAVKQSGANASDLAQIAFSDIPQGAQRHFMCSKSVDDAAIAKLSAGISSLNLGM